MLWSRFRRREPEHSLCGGRRRGHRRRHQSGAIALDREAAAERGLQVRTVEASMDDLQALRDASFDVVIHPVSTCYLPDVRRVFQEVARVTAAGGSTSASIRRRKACRRSSVERPRLRTRRAVLSHRPAAAGRR